jgi:hypothetical protein
MFFKAKVGELVRLGDFPLLLDLFGRNMRKEEGRWRAKE